jgi:hypothetical protein
VTRCRCGLPTEPPTGVKCWRPDLHVEPGPSVAAVAVYGDDPNLRRWERSMDSAGWSQHGPMVNYYGTLTPPYPWAAIGLCWANTSHAVVPLRATSGGWLAGLYDSPHSPALPEGEPWTSITDVSRATRPGE